MVEAGAEVRITGESRGTSEEDGYAAACWLLDHHPDTTALFAANDTMALGALAAAKARGLSVPADVSIIGYDNSQLAKSRYLDLTSVDNRSDVVGVDVANTLLARIQDPALEPRRKLIEPALVVRGTTARDFRLTRPPPARLRLAEPSNSPESSEFADNLRRLRNAPAIPCRTRTGDGGFRRPRVFHIATAESPARGRGA